jgi:hypothetical protein
MVAVGLFLQALISISTLYLSVSWTRLSFWQWTVRATPKSVADDY